MDDLRIVESESLVSQSGCRSIPDPVPMHMRRRLVVLSAVGFQDEATSDDEVDPPDVRQFDLTFETHSEQVQTKAQKGLQAAVRIRAREIDEPATGRGNAPTDTREIGTTQLPLSERRLERSEEHLVARAAIAVHECVLDRSETESGPSFIAVDDAVARQVMAAPVSPIHTCTVSSPSITQRP